MILIADSGSTKTDWHLSDSNYHTYKFKTIGFNPFFQDSEMIVNELKTHLKPCIDVLNLTASKTLQVHFYGAGCSSDEKRNIVKRALLQIFPKAEIFVEHDLLAAARALCGRKEGIAAIMGTGSNSCYYDGQKIISNVSSLGYILGDEGSGAYIGKHFIQDYLNRDVPSKIAENFLDVYKLKDEDILDAVYKFSMPSRFLASFSKFINQHRNEEYFINLMEYNFDQFFIKHICKYSNYKTTSLSCVGSIAYHYSDVLIRVAERREIKIDKIIESPIADLTSFHLPSK
jgi:N-acetylglucosamine kinase-like BadF-type ATPase